MEVYAIESALLRARKLGGNSSATAMTQLYTAQAFGVIEQAARRIIAAVAEARDAAYPAGDSATARRNMNRPTRCNSAARLLQAFCEPGHYAV